jgi:biotin transporter BioY
MKFKKSRLIPNLSDNQNKKLFRAMNIALIIGGLSLILTFLYMIVNLDQADKILINCLPGFVFGIILMILYAIGYQKITQNKNNRDLRKHFHSTD